MSEERDRCNITYVPIDDNNHNNNNYNRAAQPVPDASLPSPTKSSSSASSASSSSSPISDRLIGVGDGDDDPLIPPSAAIDRTSPPSRLICRAMATSPGGRWHVPDPEHEGDTAVQGLDLQYLHGRRVYFPVSYPKPVECYVYAHPPLPGHDLLSARRGLSILTIYWSYILSVRLLELQRKKLIYSQYCLLPVTAKRFKPSASEILLDLGVLASPKLVRWLCAILSPRPGWAVDDGGGCPLWAAFCSGYVRFAVAAADGPASFPSPNESPPNSVEATELLVYPILKRYSAAIGNGATREPTRIRYMNTKCLGSALWSIFCSSIPYVLKPVLESCNLGQLAKVFERWGFGSMTLPDSTVAAWTGPYMYLNKPISRSDDDSSRPLSWRPFGYVARELVELHLWPWLERGCMREYVYWVWWIKTSKGLVRDIQLGFRRDTGRFVPDVPDHVSANDVIRLGPSRDSTLRMLNFCMLDVRSSRDTCLLGVPATASHPWLKYWAGLGW
ncbi:hypothetical protein C8A01DRAFT_47926 [Parachaetomium inaequale]|uniref:Uncharacterized protein n=1 Tax=Parachaetomium inaequale TaxID=2588326 RepID=A0AAN6SQJ5_9PEZI|nr:hypothetical protein C8A01DRAFT_47926 [Parachaetomium inaequale]